MVWTVAVHYCCHTDQQDLLFTALHPSSFPPPAPSPPHPTSEYHQAVATAVLSGMLRYVSPAALAGLVDHAASSLSEAKLSKLILSLDVRVVPYDHLIRVAKERDLTAAMAYVFTEGLGDYRSAVREALPRDAGVGLHVVECVVGGVTYPHGREMGGRAGGGKKKLECVCASERAPAPPNLTSPSLSLSLSLSLAGASRSAWRR
jgi:hypothetical protein